MRTVLTVLTLVGLSSVANAQDKPKIVVQPVLQTGSYERLFVYTDKRAGYLNSGSTYDTTQKGLAVSFVGTGRWSSKLQFAIGKLETPTNFYNHSNGLHESLEFSRSSNAIATFTGNSRSMEFAEQYRRGIFTFEVGASYRMLERNTNTDIFNFDYYNGYTRSHDDATFTDNYFGPHAGIEAEKRFEGKKHYNFTAKASFGGSPWVHYAGNYEDRQPNYPASVYSASTHSSVLDTDLSGSYEIVPGISIVGGWRFAQLRTKDSEFLLGNPYGIDKTPQHDTWRGPYVSMQLTR
jgi:hypothetical protein